MEDSSTTYSIPRMKTVGLPPRDGVRSGRSSFDSNSYSSHSHPQNENFLFLIPPALRVLRLSLPGFPAHAESGLSILRTRKGLPPPIKLQ